MKGLKTYLFLPQGRSGEGVTDSYIAVKQAHINNSIAEKTERVGNHGVIFTTNKSIENVKKELSINEQYLLIDLTGNISEETISGFMPNIKIHELKSLNLENLKFTADWFESEMSEAVVVGDLDKASKIGKEIKKKIGK